MRPKRSIYFLALFIVPLPVLVALQNTNLSEPVHGWSLSFLKPALVAGNGVVEGLGSGRSAIGNFWKTFHDQGASEARIAELENELRRLNETLKENERLKKLLQFRQTFAAKTVAARVIGWDPSPWRRTVILDKGKKQGIKKDMPVVVAEGLVGRILEVGPSVSRVILITDPNSRVTALADQSRAQGVIEGDGSSNLTMTYLELDSNVAVEEMVMTSGTSDIFPKGFRIGKIKSISKDSNGLHLEAQVESYVKFSKLEEVLCLVSSQGK
jgi:rod shape-determining protein MreC